MSFICAESGISVAERISLLRASQNPDGGWGYAARGSSWTEPTVFAVMALATAKDFSESIRHGLLWLQKQQRGDGGWPPHASVDQSTWVTALAAMALRGRAAGTARNRAIEWLQRQTGEESTLLVTMRRLLLGVSLEAGEGTTGWPWFPGNAAWVMPTALTILALEQAGSTTTGPLARRIRQGREFLLARICSDGGWNHGSSKALGYEAESYPETTGVALLALRGVQSPRIQRAVARAEQHWSDCRSAQGLSWLWLGLRAHGRPPEIIKEGLFEKDNTLDLALTVLSRQAAAGARLGWGDL